MIHKEFKRARREWLVIAEDEASFADPSCDPVLGRWARRHGLALINEVQRLRTELKSRNKKKRAVHARLAFEQDDHDDLIEEIERLKDWIVGAPCDTSLTDIIAGRIDEILKPYREDDHD